MVLYFVSMMLAAMVSASVMVLEHYVPWILYLTGRERLHPVANYILGLLGILIPYTGLTVITLQLSGVEVSPVLATAALWVIVAAAGVATAACYLADFVWATWRRAREAEQREALHQRQQERGA